jgi:hypothetical protein
LPHRCLFSPMLEPITIHMLGCENHAMLTRFDPILTLTRTQYPAIVSNTGNRKLLIYAGFAISCHTQQPLTAHS